MSLRDRSVIREGDRWINRHTDEEVTIMAVAPAPHFDGETRVLCSADLQPSMGTNNGWSIEMWRLHWRRLG